MAARASISARVAQIRRFVDLVVSGKSQRAAWIEVTGCEDNASAQVIGSKMWRSAEAIAYRAEIEALITNRPNKLPTLEQAEASLDATIKRMEDSRKFLEASSVARAACVGYLQSGIWTGAKEILEGLEDPKTDPDLLRRYHSLCESYEKTVSFDRDGQPVEKTKIKMPSKVAMMRMLTEMLDYAKPKKEVEEAPADDDEKLANPAMQRALLEAMREANPEGFQKMLEGIKQ